MSRRRNCFLLFAGLAFSTLALLPVRMTSASELNIALSTDVTMRDPASAINNMAASFLFNVFDGLYAPNAQGQVVPRLAVDRVTSADGLTQTLTLRQGVKFQDGSAFTSADVKFSLERALERGRLVPSRVDISSISSVDTDGPYKVVVHLNRINPILDHSLTSPVALIVPKDYVTAVGDKGFSERPIGTGAYRFSNAQTGQYTKIEAWEGYWGSAPLIKTITFWSMPEAATQVSALRSGQIDMIGATDPTLTPLLRDFKLIAHPSAEFMWIQWQVTNPALADVRVRRAFNMAIDREPIVESIFKGYGVPIGTLSGPGYVGYDAHQVPTKYDPETARKLLAEAKWNPETVVSLSVPRGRFAGMEQAAQVIVSDLAKVGVKARLDFVEYNEWLKSLSQKTVSGMTVDNFNNRTFDPVGLFRVEVSCAGGFSVWCDPEFDRLVGEIDPLAGAAREAAIKHLLTYFYANPAGLTLWANKTIYAMKKTVNFKPTAGTYILYNLETASVSAAGAR